MLKELRNHILRIICVWSLLFQYGLILVVFCLLVINLFFVFYEFELDITTKFI